MDGYKERRKKRRRGQREILFRGETEKKGGETGNSRIRKSLEEGGERLKGGGEEKGSNHRLRKQGRNAAGFVPKENL